MTVTDKAQPKNLVVLKFGGSSMGDSVSAGGNFPQVAAIIKNYQQEYKNVIVVVSALAGETRRLKQIAEQLQFDDQNKDRILSFGESMSSWMLAAYLTQNGLPAKDMNGTELPVYTNDKAGAADIKRVDTAAITANLQKQIVVIPGFIGKNTQGHIATLGFDGSDTTAIAVASAMGADRVCLFKDVNGIYSANPRKVAARHYDKLSLNDMWYFARAGARIVHPKAIETAMKNNFDIQILPSFSEGQGTLLTNNCEDREVVGVTYQENKHCESYGKIIVTVVGNNVCDSQKGMKHILSRKQIKFSDYDEFNTQKSYSITLEQKEQLEECLKTVHNYYGLDKGKQSKVKNHPDHKQLYFDPALANAGMLKIAPFKLEKNRS